MTWIRHGVTENSLGAIFRITHLVRIYISFNQTFVTLCLRGRNLEERGHEDLSQKSAARRN